MLKKNNIIIEDKDYVLGYPIQKFNIRRRNGDVLKLCFQCKSHTELTRLAKLIEPDNNILVINEQSCCEESIIAQVTKWQCSLPETVHRKEVVVHLHLSSDEYLRVSDNAGRFKLKESFTEHAENAGILNKCLIYVIITRLIDESYIDSCLSDIECRIESDMKISKALSLEPLQKYNVLPASEVALAELKSFYENNPYTKPFPDKGFLTKYQKRSSRLVPALNPSNEKVGLVLSSTDPLIHLLSRVSCCYDSTSSPCSPKEGKFSSSNIHDHLIAQLMKLASNNLNYFVKVEGAKKNQPQKLGEEGISNNLNNLLNGRDGFTSTIETPAGSGRVDINLKHTEFPFTGARIEAKKLSKLNVRDPDKPMINKAYYDKFLEAIGQIVHYLKNYEQYQGYIVYYLFDITPNNFFTALVRTIAKEVENDNADIAGQAENDKLQIAGRTEKGVGFTLKHHNQFSTDDFPDATNRNIPTYGIQISDGPLIRLVMVELCTKVQK
ncbi:hypothetical protein [Vibrio parahaemolyticus]|uniref:hypothetical protein n=1 Tax=Vibrio parahaemolyticus TaxID=670 RepID=UPI00387B3FFC